jgi:MYXO-CTERM domain-containing protein
MKKCLLLVAMMALAVPAFAYVTPGQLTPGIPQQTEDPLRFDVAGGSRLMPNRSPKQQAPPVSDGEASPAVPEPGTMTLAAMGLAAAGAAVRRRKNSVQ